MKRHRFVRAREGKGGASRSSGRPAQPWDRSGRPAAAARPPVDTWSTEDWVLPEPTWLEHQLGRRLAPAPRASSFNAPLMLGPSLAIRTRTGVRAIAQEVRPDQWLVSLAPADVSTQLAGIGFIGPALNLADTAIKSIVDAVNRAKANKAARAAAPSPAIPQDPPEPQLGCAGTCRCGGAR